MRLDGYRQGGQDFSSTFPRTPGLGALMDPLRKNDIERFRRMSADERMKAVFETVNAGFRIQLAVLRARYPRASDQEIEAHLRNWLRAEHTNARDSNTTVTKSLTRQNIVSITIDNRPSIYPPRHLDRTVGPVRVTFSRSL